MHHTLVLLLLLLCWCVLQTLAGQLQEPANDIVDIWQMLCPLYLL
jgi:hypothetical protein